MYLMLDLIVFLVAAAPCCCHDADPGEDVDAPEDPAEAAEARKSAAPPERPRWCRRTLEEDSEPEPEGFREEKAPPSLAVAEEEEPPSTTQ